MPVEFTNNQIDTSALPRYETVVFRKLESDYLKVIFIRLAIAAIVLAVLFGISYAFVEVDTVGITTTIVVAAIYLFVAIAWIVSFHKRGFAFRDHDVLYRSGLIATNITIIPYNRIQHVVLHEGLFSRMFGLAEIKVFTAGMGSDIEVPGIRKDEAQAIKQLLTGKIQKQLS